MRKRESSKGKEEMIREGREREDEREKKIITREWKGMAKIKII